VELIWKRNGPDHYCHTLLYALVGMDRFGMDGALMLKRHSNFLVPKATTVDNTVTGSRFIGKSIEGLVDF
jgi:hypothetical protein